MSNVKQYWQRHPVQLRIVALLALIFVPIWFPIAALAVYWREVAREFKIQYRDLWRALIHGRDA